MNWLEQQKIHLLSYIALGKKRKFYRQEYKKIRAKKKQKEIIKLIERVNNIENYLNNIEYELCDKYNFIGKEKQIPSLMSLDQTLDEISINKKSIARFGDGEFRFMLGDNNLKDFYFGTDFSLSLQNRLREVLTSREKNILICLWDNFGCLDKFTEHGKMVARIHMPKLREKLIPYIDCKRIYGNLNITRPYLIYKDKSHCQKIFNRWKEIWNNKDIVIIEGEYSKLGVGNDLFSNTRSVKRILCPSQNAWSKYDEILAASLKLSKDKLILIALGMTATVLAYDLAKVGYWAIDIGHIDIEYEWFLKGIEKPTSVDGKYTNDAAIGGGINKQTLSLDQIPEYKSQVIQVIR